MESTSDADLVSDELDELAVRILNLMNQFIVCKTNIENHIRCGCLDLAKARYIKGNHNISSLQLPSEDAIGVTAKFRVLSITTGPDSVVHFRSVENEVENLTEGMKKVDIDGDDPSRESKRIKRFSNEPIKWFGILVPQDLRNSMNVFERCLEVVIECSNIQSELIKCMDKYDECKKKISCI